MLPKTLTIIASLLIIIGAASQNYYVRKTVSQYTGLLTVKIMIAGTGSMYPTFPKGKGKTPQELHDETVATIDVFVYPSGVALNGKRFLGYQLVRGDIVEIQNSKTEQILEEKYGEKGGGFVKRIVGLPSETVEIRDGNVLINDQIIKEPYTALPRSTFGGEFLPDCTKLKIPANKFFVMGDNRKGSGDSRHDIGLVDIQDIHFVLPVNKQTGVWDKNYRDTRSDNQPTAKIKINKQKYLEYINENRRNSGLNELKYNEKLEKSARLRGGNMIKFNDFSFEATRSGYRMTNAMSEAGYWNPITSESFIQGYYEAEELMESNLEQQEWKEFILNKDLDDFGISEVEGEVSGCPTQVIVQHFAGYVPPDYPQDQIDSWRNSLTRLREIQPGWQQLSTEEGFSEFYSKNKSDVDRINQIIARRISNTEAIVKKMETNEWLSPVETGYIKEDESLGVQQSEVADKLNSNNQQE